MTRGTSTTAIVSDVIRTMECGAGITFVADPVKTQAVLLVASDCRAMVECHARYAGEFRAPGTVSPGCEHHPLRQEEEEERTAPAEMADLPDLSHLTPEERRIIESVMMRQKQEEERENEIMSCRDKEYVRAGKGVSKHHISVRLARARKHLKSNAPKEELFSLLRVS
uniref:(California timema) hypothetical protein n=1 Tax=Timema californicum TaxID=61474 RepID=A0A7R9JC73_TIMCA|nr:unnamed protein product [Timema californicum]